MIYLPSIFVRVVLVLLMLSDAAIAGHPEWENGYKILTEKVNATLEQRWYIIAPTATGANKWPGIRIPFCYESPASRALVHNDVVTAWGLWQSAGLGTRFIFEEGTLQECSPSNRVNILYIMVNDQGKLATSVGKTPAQLQDPVSDGPTMHLSPQTGVGTLDVYANYAHEIGHAWGLYHEHQRPDFWGAPVNELGTPMFTFNCANLRDYPAMIQKITDATQQVRACEDQVYAATQKFSAAEFLPIRAGVGSTLSSYEASAIDVDWDSIMLYGTGVGGAGTATNPQNDNRQPVLLRQDGTSIPLNRVPSLRDIDGLNTLYPEITPISDPCLPDQPCSPDQNRFKNVFKKGLKKCGIGKR